LNQNTFLKNESARRRTQLDDPPPDDYTYTNEQRANRMRTAFSSVAILASSLLAREIVAAPHLHRHKRDVVTDVVLVTEEIVVTAEGDGSYETGLPFEVGKTTIHGTPVDIPATPVPTPKVKASSIEPPTTSTVSTLSTVASTTSALPLSSSKSPSTPGAIFVQKPSESEAALKPKTTAEPPTSTTHPTVVIPAATLPTVVPAPEQTPAPASNSGGKRGLAYNDASLLSGFASSPQVSWVYNWASSTSTVPSNLEYVPVLWGMGSQFTSVWNAYAAGASHLMSFNEPDYYGQADLSVSAAVAGYMQYMQPFAGEKQIGAPAVTNGGGSMGLTYLGNFISGLKQAGGIWHFCCVHWYDSASNIDYFKSFLQDASTTCEGKPIWLTEFGASGSTDQQTTFLETVLPWLDSQPFIARYAYFMVAPDNLISSGTTVSPLGKTYADFT